MQCWAIIAAGGSGSRLAEASTARPKQFLEMEGIPLYWHGARTLARVAALRGIVFAFPPRLLDDAKKQLDELATRDNFPLPYYVVPGGEQRQDSVRNALMALPAECDHVLVHDAARPFMTAKLAVAVITALEAGHKAVIPGVPLVDTIKEVNSSSIVNATHERSNLQAVQTPQGFSRVHLTKAHADAVLQNLTVTDDASLMEFAGFPVLVIPGEEGNKKITTSADLDLLRKDSPMPIPLPRIGFGYDVHAYGGNRPLILGGVPIPTQITIFAHSDGDVLLHALIDAILGCLGRGDIGTLFPDTNPHFAGIESGVLLSEVMSLAFTDGVKIVHADLTVVAQIPKISPYRERIAANIARLLSLSPNAVNVKSTTEEKLGFTGEKKGIKAYAVVTALAGVEK